METEYSGTQASQDFVRELLQGVCAEDPHREGLIGTPQRYVKFLHDFTHPEPYEFTTFANEGGDDMIVQTAIPFYSLCEHHLAPFFGTASVAYLPRDRIVGLSKLARCVDTHSRALQNQERITFQIAQTLEKKLSSTGVAVVLKARHLCMEMRGVKKPGTHTITSRLTGAFFDNPSCRQEFFDVIRLHG